MNVLTQRRLRILVADDSAVMRGIMRSLFAAHAENPHADLPPMEICGLARDGVECLEAVARLQPDVLLLDLEMPRMHGLDVLDRLQLNGTHLPVIMCSAYTERGARSTLDALARGASDYVMKPSEQSDFAAALQTLSEQLLPKVAALANLAPTPPRTAATPAPNPSALPLGSRLKAESAAPPQPASPIDVIVIGISTGGPAALELMLPMLPADLPVPVMIVQHMPKLFTGALAHRLNQCCALRVKEAHQNATLSAGTIWLAPGDMHMEVRSQIKPLSATRAVQVCLHHEAPVNYCRPSVDHLFHSAVQVYGAATLAVVMTGMGSDGLSGARAVHQAGGTVLAQDETTSVVWGMPGRVAQSGIASATLPLTLLANELIERASVGRNPRMRRPFSLPHPPPQQAPIQQTDLSSRPHLEVRNGLL